MPIPAVWYEEADELLSVVRCHDYAALQANLNSFTRWISFPIAEPRSRGRVTHESAV